MLRRRPVRPARRVVVAVVVAAVLAGLVAVGPAAAGRADRAQRRRGAAGRGRRAGRLRTGWPSPSSTSTAARRSARPRWARTSARRFEAGSVTKALTGLVIADQVERGELDLDTPVAGAARPRRRRPCPGPRCASSSPTTRGCHRSTRRPGCGPCRPCCWGWTPTGASAPPSSSSAPAARTPARRQYAYSNLGAALAGQAAAAAAGTDYPTLVQERLFTPLGLAGTTLQTAEAAGAAPGAARWVAGCSRGSSTATPRPVPR